MTTLRVVPCTQQLFTEYVQAHAARGNWTPPAHAEGIWVIDETGAFVAGVQLFAAGPYLLAEDLATSIKQPLRLRHAAAELIAGQAVGFAIASCKTLRMTVRSKGLRRMLRRLGFKTQAALPMFFLPAVISFPQAEKRTPRGHDSPGRSAEHGISKLDPSTLKMGENNGTVKARTRRKAARAHVQERK